MRDFILRDKRRAVFCVLTGLAVLLFLSGCSSGKGTVKPDAKSAIANPASVNCIDKGGTLSIQKRGDGGEYGICIFEDNRQCEEWALFRGECPAGGIKITGYVTPAARYCAIPGVIHRNRPEQYRRGTGDLPIEIRKILRCLELLPREMSKKVKEHQQKPCGFYDVDSARIFPVVSGMKTCTPAMEC